MRPTSKLAAATMSGKMYLKPTTPQRKARFIMHSLTRIYDSHTHEVYDREDGALRVYYYVRVGGITMGECITLVGKDADALWRTMLNVASISVTANVAHGYAIKHSN
jgi:hypothetical protein